jgi:penicillin amidase
LFGILGIVPLVGFLAFWVLWATVPPDSQTVHIPGLSEPVDISFDDNGVPRIHAANERDAAAALGFVHARDRMFQMDLMRRAASGRLSEILGPATLPIDKQMRVLGLGRLAEGDVAAQTPETRALLEAYASGVNAWIAARGRFSAMEFLFLGAPEPWRPADSLMWGRTMGLWLSSNYRTELSRLALRDKVPLKELEQLWPPHPRPLPPQASLSPGLGGEAAGVLAALPAFPAPFTLPSTASDAWAVDGRLSDTGAPLLAGDPHLSFDFPGLWYLVRIDLPGEVLAGATGPGVPFLVMGHNSRIAWTFTTTGADTQDVYLEPPEAKFTSHEERIKVRGQPDVVITVRETRHGPVISDLRAGATATGPAMAVAMENLQPRDTAASGLLALNHAHSVEDAGKAAALIESPVQNLMVADQTKIGLFVTGRVPIRRHGDGWAPVPGISSGPADAASPSEAADDYYGWSGFASGDALPHVVAPSSGRLVNGNEPVWPPDFPVFMGRDTFSDWRARRIRTLLNSMPKHSTSDFASMQTDVVSTYAAALLPTLRVVPGAPQVLRDWDGAMTENAPQPLIFSAWMEAFHHAVLAKAGIPMSASSPVFEFVPFVLSPEGASWCGGDCAPLLKSTLDSTMSSLAARFGPDPNAWRWGAVHQAVFAHPVLRSVPILGALTTSRIAVPGDGATLDRGGTNDALEAVHGASYRGVYDLADLDRSLFIMTPGQSGNPLSRHARDFLTRWRDGALVLLAPKPVDVSATARLEP